MDRLVLTAETRKETGKVFAKALRKQGRLPAVMYNSKGEAQMLSVNEADFIKVRKQATPTTLINLEVDGKKKIAFIKDTHYDIISDRDLHADFHLIDEDKPLKIKMKILVSGNPVGVREGGIFEKSQVCATIQCLPKDLPVRITADVNNLGLGECVCVKDLPFAKGVTILSDQNAVVAHIKDPRS
ncbi:MAG: 50S ribosomal protein L25 [Treponemataceae bacterium]